MKNKKIMLLSLIMLLTGCSNDALAATQFSSSNNITLSTHSNSSVVNLDSGESTFNYDTCYKGTVTVLNYTLVNVAGQYVEQLGSFGSGFFFTSPKFSNSKYYYIMSNNHVIDGCNKLSIITSYGQTINDVKIIGYDTIQDVSVLRVDKSSLKGALSTFASLSISISYNY